MTAQSVLSSAAAAAGTAVTAFGAGTGPRLRLHEVGLSSCFLPRHHTRCIP